MKHQDNLFLNIEQCLSAYSSNKEILFLDKLCMEPYTMLVLFRCDWISSPKLVSTTIGRAKSLWWWYDNFFGTC